MNYDLSKIRIKCAEIVGWKRVNLNHDLRICHYVANKEYIIHSAGGICDWLPNYPESADAALELVAWMGKPENGGWHSHFNNDLEDWRAWFHHPKHDGQHGRADTFPLAVCLAFLKANNIEPESL